MHLDVDDRPVRLQGMTLKTFAALGVAALATTVAASPAHASTTTADACIQVWLGTPHCLGLQTPCYVAGELGAPSPCSSAPLTAASRALIR